MNNQHDKQKLSDNRFDIDFIKSGLGTGNVAAETINFILQEQQEKNKKKALDGINFQKNQLLKTTNISDSNKEITRNKTNLQFMNNHGPQMFIKDKEKKWNTGTRDTANLFTPKTQYNIEDYNLSDYEWQKAVNQQYQQRKNKSNNKPNQPIINMQELNASMEVAKAMRERERKEALELERMCADVDNDEFRDEAFESGVFEQEVKLAEMRRADQLRQQGRFLELQQLETLKHEAELQKWKDTGYEDEIARVYLNPLERKAAEKRDRERKLQKLEYIPEHKVGKNIKETMNLIKEQQKYEKRESNRKQLQHEKQSLFEKSQTGSYLTLDGSIKFEHGRIPTSQGSDSYMSLKDQRMLNNTARNQLEQYKNKIISQSRFFVLKQPSSVPMVQSTEAQMIHQNKKQQIQIYKSGIQMISEKDLEPSYAPISKKKNMRSNNLSAFALESQNAQARIPGVKEWFENLELSDRILAVTTIDNEITTELKSMHNKLTKSINGEFSKFRMHTTTPNPMTMIITNSQGTKKDESEKFQSKKPARVMKLVGSSTYKSSNEVIDSEKELLQFIRFTDTYLMHDTLTVSEDLIKEPSKFYRLAETIVGTNYLKQPHDIKWLDEDDTPPFEFESAAPLWLNMYEPNSIAGWILYYIERALFIQYFANVKGQFQSCRDSMKQPIFIGTDGKNIIIKYEIKPYWRQFCEDVQKDDNNVQELVKLIKDKASEEFKIYNQGQKNIDAFDGGLALHSQRDSDKQALVDKIDEFTRGVVEAAKNFTDNPSEPRVNSKQLNLKEVCMNTLQESSSLSSPVNFEQIGIQYCFSVQMSQAAKTKKANEQYQSPEVLHVNMRLERILIEQFRNLVTSQLKSRFNTSNRRLQKKKIKKLKLKEQEREKERQLEEEKKRAVKEEITVNVVNAVELLIGTSSLPKQEPPIEVQQPASKGGKKKRKGKRQAEQEEKKQEIAEAQAKDPVPDKKLNDITIANLPVKSSTPKEQQKTLPQTSKKVDPQNYFQVLEHKYAASLESQGGSNVGSEISKTTPLSKGLENSQRDSRGGTIRTLSTNEESKKTRQDMREKAEQAMSNQEVLNLYKQSSTSSQGNSQINKKSWQRKAHQAGEMINELLSETSCSNENVQKKDDVRIKPKIQGNYLLPELDESGSVNSHTSDIKIPSAENSSHSSVKDSNRILKITKAQNRKVIPRRQIQSSESESSSSDDPDQDLLPDIYTTIRPEDNDSSDYGLETGQGDDESVDDDSSVALSKTMSGSKKRGNLQTSPQQVQKSRSRRHRHDYKTKYRSANSKKTIKSANAKAVEPIEEARQQTGGNKKPKINFYPNRGYEEEEEVDEPQLIYESEKIIHRWTQLKPNQPLTCVYITMSKELQTEGHVKKKQGKTKAQRKADWKKYQDVSDEVQPKQIEIIKPDENAAKAQRQAQVQQNTQKPQNQNQQLKTQEPKQNAQGPKQDKKNKKKNVTQGTPAANSSSAASAAMNQFMKKMHGSEPADKKVASEPVAEKTAPNSTQETGKETAGKEQQKADAAEKLAKVPASEYQKKKEQGTKYPKPRQPTATEYAKKLKPDAAHQPADRLSMMEEAKILKDGYHYQVKKPQPLAESKEKTKMQEDETQAEGAKDLQTASKPVAAKHETGKVEKSGLSIESKEYQVTHKTRKAEDAKQVSSLTEAIEGHTELPVEQQPNPEPKKKVKKKASRSNKGRKKHGQSQQNQLQNMQNTGQPMLMDFLMGQQAQGGFDSDQLGFLTAQGSQQFGINKQVQDFIYQLNQQVMVQQQAQLQEMQMREQEEAETLMQEECEPCQETNPMRYDQFFELLEVEMENKVKEIDQLKDSVRKERQGFISIIETIVKDTFSNRYGNGYVGIKTFGSMATELAIETSDVDLVVTGIDSFQSSYNYGREYSGKNQLLRMMQKLYDNLCYLKDKGLIYKIKFIQGANVPIIKLVADLQMINKSQIEKAIERINLEREEDEESGEQKEERKRRSVDLSELGLEAKDIAPTMRYLQVDISIDEQSHQYLKFDNKGFGNAPRNHSGIDTIYHIQDLVKKRKDLRPIVMIMKKIFDGTFLSMPYYGGISSYSLVLMVSAYLKAYDAEKEASISRNLSSFFHFYGSQFKPHMYYLNGDEIVHCEDPAQRPFQDPFIVLDPLETSNNISHSTFRIKDIQRALVKAFIIINKSCEQYQLLQDDIITAENMQCQPKQVLERLITEIKQEYFSPSQYLDE